MCCLFGLIDYGNCLTARKKEKIIKILSTECEVRGTHATGIAYMLNDTHMTIYKDHKAAHLMTFKFKNNPKVIMGHTRYTTQGSELYNANNHPFYSNQLGFALAHNGILWNDKDLRVAHALPETNIQTDSYIAVQLIDSKGILNFDSLKYMAEEIRGSFCFTVLNKNNDLYIVKGDNPMAIAKFDGYYIYASTMEILSAAIKKLKLKTKSFVQVNDGDILKIDNKGNITWSSFDMVDDYYSSPYFRTGFNNSASWKPANYDYDYYDDDYYEDLFEFAKLKGIEPETLMDFLDMGYTYMEIEDMLYDPKSELFEYNELVLHNYYIDDIDDTNEPQDSTKAKGVSNYQLSYNY